MFSIFNLLIILATGNYSTVLVHSVSESLSESPGSSGDKEWGIEMEGFGTSAKNGKAQ